MKKQEGGESFGWRFGAHGKCFRRRFLFKETSVPSPSSGGRKVTFGTRKRTASAQCGARAAVRLLPVIESKKVTLPLTLDGER